jgi:hypothetical protein
VREILHGAKPPNPRAEHGRRQDGGKLPLTTLPYPRSYAPTAPTNHVHDVNLAASW